MLDMKRTFDDLVDRFADDAAAKERILSNPIYAHVSDALAGSAEYSAMEKVYELAGREDLDLIVLDTPPSQHALDFLEAPERLIGFLDSRLVQFLLHPAFAGARFGFRLWSRGVHQVFKVLERVSGFSFLEDLSEFLLAIEGMSEGSARGPGGCAVCCSVRRRRSCSPPVPRRRRSRTPPSSSSGSRPRARRYAASS